MEYLSFPLLQYKPINFEFNNSDDKINILSKPNVWIIK